MKHFDSHRIQTLVVAVAAIAAVIVLAGCTGGETRVAEDRNDSLETNQPEQTSEPQDTGQENQSSTEATESSQPAVKRFQVGDRITDGDLIFTVNSVDYVTHIPSDNPYLEADAGQNQQYVVADVTLENRMNNSVTVSSVLRLEVASKQGYTYNPNFLSINFEKGFKSGTIVPGEKRRGLVVFTTPRNPGNLSLRYTFNHFTGTTAIVNLPDKELRWSVEHKNKPNPKAEVTIEDVDASFTYSEYIENYGSINSVSYKVENTGEIGFIPRIDLEYQHGATTRSFEDQATIVTDIEPGATHRETLFLGEEISEGGTYRIQVMVMNPENGDRIDSDMRTIDVG